MASTHTIVVGLVLIAAFGCGGAVDSKTVAAETGTLPDDSAEHAGLWLAAAPPSSVSVVRSSGVGVEPRMVELWLRGTNVAAIAGSVPGVALTASHKDLIVQDKGNGLFRVLAFSSSNTTPIGPGVLASLELERETDGPMRVEILTDRPMFAPQEAQEGLIVGDPIEL